VESSSITSDSGGNPGFFRANLWQIVFLLAVALLFSLPSIIGYAGKPAIPQVNDIAEEDIIAPMQFDVKKSPDSLEAEKRTLIRSVPVIVIFSQNVQDSVLNIFDKTWNGAKSIVKSKSIQSEQKADSLKILFPYLSQTQIEQLNVMKDIDDFSRNIRGGLTTSYTEGFIAVNPIPFENPPELYNIRKRNREELMTESAVQNDSTIKISLKQYFELQYRNSPDHVTLGLAIGEHFLIPNLLPDIEQTEKNRLEALKQISPIKMRVSRGEKIIGKHEKITEEIHLKLISLYDALQGKTRGKDTFQRILAAVGTFLIAVLIVSLLGAYIFMKYRKFWSNLRILCTIIFSIILVGSIAHIVQIFGLSVYAIPVLFIPVIITALFDDWLAFAASIATVLLVAIGFSGNTTFLAAYILSAAIVSFRARQVNLRNMLYRPVTYSMLAGLLAVAVFNLVMFTPAGDILKFVTEFGISAFMAPFLALIVLPLAEKVSRTASEFTLMDLSDINSILLRKLSIEAPGTFNHSILVGNTAAAAAEAIGANSVLARAGGYYHDIGKLVHPEYFDENQTGRNPHDSLSPFDSFRILSSHTREGVELGKLHKLPDVVLNIIEQHHGTTVMDFFYHKAKDLNPAVIPDEFRYPNPKPENIETALVMICDTAEAALRSQRENLPGTEIEIGKLVERMIMERIEDGQFDYSPISIMEINVAIKTILPILRGVHHTRIAREFQQSPNAIEEP